MAIPLFRFFRLHRRFRLGLVVILLVSALALPGLKVLCAEAAKAEERSPAIVLNQVGYLPEWPKQALLLNDAAKPGQPVSVVSLDSQETVATLMPQPARYDDESKSFLQELDFSDVIQPGHYELRHGELRSAPFQVGEDLYEKPMLTLLRSFYLQRCGVAVDDPITGLYHPPCHIHDGKLAHDDSQFERQGKLKANSKLQKAGAEIAGAGGWHDAGDYGKYVATTTVTISRLLNLYEQQPQRFTDGQLAIPESGSGQPDLLDEMRVGLDWLMRMQRADGAVYRKLSGGGWPHNKGPFEDDQTRYVYGISTPETGKFAATLAQAARIYQPGQPKLAQQYREAALLAWRFLEQEPEMRVDWLEGDDAGSGKYLSSEIDREAALKVDVDDRLWAAVELYITTGESRFGTYLEQHFEQVNYDLFEWKNPTSLALVDYLQQERQPGNESLRKNIRSQVIKRADGLLRAVDRHGYDLANQRFIWGSNKMTAEEGITLALAYQLTGKEAYRNGAIAQLDFLLGRNPFNLSFVSGVGDRPVKRVNHLFARAKNLYIPGLLVGGPNDAAQDNVAPKGLGLLSYVDDETSYATNEYAIDYNASLIGLIGALTESSQY